MRPNRVQLSKKDLKSYLEPTPSEPTLVFTDSQGYKWFNLSLKPDKPIVRKKTKPDSKTYLISTAELTNLESTLKRYIRDMVALINNELTKDHDKIILTNDKLAKIFKGNDVLTILNTIRNSNDKTKQFEYCLKEIDEVLKKNYLELNLRDETYKEKIESIFNKLFTTKFNKLFTTNTKTTELSTINLEKEFIYYIAHKINVFNKTLKEMKDNEKLISDADFRKILLNDTDAIISTIQKKTETILKNQNLTTKQKNKQLDALRVELTELANQKLKAYFGLPTDVDANEFSEKFKRHLENTPSFLEPITIIQINPNQTVDVFESAKNSAHEYKKDKDTTAQLSRYRYAENTDDEPQLLYSTTRTDILVPHPDTYGKRSIFQRYGFNKSRIETQQLEDTKNKISGLSKDFSDDQPIFYNLFTSVPYPADINEPKNQQTSRVKILLKAQDAFNKDLSTNSKKYFLTLNIPSNGFGYPPSPYSISPLARELSLRNDMAIAMILGSTIEQKELMDLYKDFLQSEKIYIKDSNQVKEIRKKINEIKNNNIPACDESNAFECTLRFIYQNNLHYTHEFALLTQTMALLCEKQSINGCKSGNERTAQVLGRVEQGEKLKDYIIEILNQDQSKNTPQEKVRSIASMLNDIYNQEGIYGITTDISLSDQGAVSKIKTQKPYLNWIYPQNWLKNIGIFFKNLNSNLAEPSTIDNIQNSNTGSMQAHKLKSFNEQYFSEATKEKGDTILSDSTTEILAGLVVNSQKNNQQVSLEDIDNDSLDSTTKSSTPLPASSNNQSIVKSDENNLAENVSKPKY